MPAPRSIDERVFSTYEAVLNVLVERATTRVGRSLLATLASLEGVAVRTVGERRGADVVVDAGLLPAGVDSVLDALAAGCHWVDLCWQRSWSKEIATLDERAKSEGRAVVCAAGAFSGLTDPFVRVAATELVRVNEVLLGVAVGDLDELDDESFAMLLASRDRTVRMLIGGEWSERRFFGDTRTFFFPPPLGDRRGSNVDAVDLELFTGRGVKATSVRLTVAPPSGLAMRGARAFLGAAHRGRIRAPENNAGKWRKWARRLGGRKPWCLAIFVRGIGGTRLPVEYRTAFLPSAGRAEALSVAPAVELVRTLRADPVAGAGAASGRVSAADLERRLVELGVQVVRGDMGGWRAAPTGTSDSLRP